MLSAQGDQTPGAEQQEVAGPATDGCVTASSGCASPASGTEHRGMASVASLDSLRVGKQLSAPFPQKRLPM